MKKVTVDDIMDMNPCSTYPRERVEKLFGRKKYITIKDVSLSKLDGADDYLWLVLREEFITETNLHKIAIYSAELVLPIFEKEYPDDDRPRKAIQAKRDWLKGKITDGELSAARSAAGSAEGSAARSAAWSAAGSAEGKKIIAYIKKITR